jgi:NAD(P)H-nitrite reductase large subunit
METGLFYKQEWKTTQVKTIELRVPKDWGMYSIQGNKSIRLKAEKLVKTVKRTSSTIEKMKAFTDFFKEYRRLQKTKTMAESGDTAVREQVWGFAVDLGKCVDLSYSTLDKLWESEDSNP